MAERDEGNEDCEICEKDSCVLSVRYEKGNTYHLVDMMAVSSDS